VRKVCLGAFLVVFDRADVAAIGDADDDGHGQRALVPIAHSGQLGGDLVEAGEDKPVELDLADRAVTAHGQADRRAHDAGLGQRRVKHALGPELGVQPFGDAEHTTERADVLAHQDHLRVILHGFLQAGVQRLGQRKGRRTCGDGYGGHGFCGAGHAPFPSKDAS
jgi:hypothetical protein